MKAVTPGQLIQEIIAETGLSVCELAEKSGVNASQIYKVIRGGNMTFKSLSNIAESINRKVVISLDPL